MLVMWVAGWPPTNRLHSDESLSHTRVSFTHANRLHTDAPLVYTRIACARTVLLVTYSRRVQERMATPDQASRVCAGYHGVQAPPFLYPGSAGSATADSGTCITAKSLSVSVPLYFRLTSHHICVSFVPMSAQQNRGDKIMKQIQYTHL